VLVFLADKADKNGTSFPKVAHIAQKTELAKRTVERAIQIFVELELVKKEANCGSRKDLPGFSINRSLLGGDLSDRFKDLHAKAQRKTSKRSRLSDAKLDVSKTQQSVSESNATVAETSVSVSKTNSDTPIYIGTPSEPQLSHQREHHPTTPPFSSPHASILYSPEALANAIISELRLGGRFLHETLTEVVQHEIDTSVNPDTLKEQMVTAVRKYKDAAYLLKHTVTMERFFGDGLWKDQNGWAWDHEKLRATQGSNFGAATPQESDAHRDINGESLNEKIERYARQDAQVDEAIAMRFPGEALERVLQEIARCAFKGESPEVLRRITPIQRRDISLNALHNAMRDELGFEFQFASTVPAFMVEILRANPLLSETNK
jgi:hypothetical protein